jgi:hypothetical protein
MSDRDEAGFHGQVKTCIEETVYPQGGKFAATTEYSLDGKRLTIVRFLPTPTTMQGEV